MISCSFNSSDWCISILSVRSVICSLGGPLSQGSPVVVFFDRGHSRFWNFYSTIPVDIVMVKLLFTSIPLQLALQCTETAILQSTDPLPLPTEDIMDLLNLCLTSTYFQYNGKHYKQLHGTAMGSPVSVVVAEIVMQNIEESALSTCRQTIPLWLRYIDDTFTREDEENGKLPFLDCMVSRDDNSLRTTVYRKLTHTDRLLDESSYNPTSHKATTIRTLTRRAQLVCNTTDSLSDENKFLNCVFSKSNYNEDFIQRNTHSPTTTTKANDNATPMTTATIPYIKGISHASYNHSISASLKNLLPQYVSY